MTILLIILIVAVIFWIVYSPKIGGLLIWPILFMYPHGIQQRMNMPMNIGFDDLLILFIAVAAWVRYSKVNNSLSYVSFRLVLLMFAINVFANFSGFAQVGPLPGLFEAIIKQILKMGVLMSLSFIIIKTTQTTEDCWRTAKWIVFSIAASGVILLISSVIPALNNIFGVIGPFGEGVIEGRAFGALISANTASVVLICGLCLCIPILEYSSGITKIFYFVLSGVLVVSVFYTRSRTGFLAIASIPPLLLFMHRMRKWAVCYTLGGLSLLMFFPEVIINVAARLGNVFLGSGLGSGLTSEAYSRVGIWNMYLSSMTPISTFFGQGHTVAQFRANIDQYPHSGYLDLFCYFGIWGILWFIMVMYAFFSAISRLKQLNFADTLLWRNAVIMFMFVICIVSMSMDSFQPGGFGLILTLSYLSLIDCFVRCYTEQAYLLEYGDEYDGDYAQNTLYPEEL